MAAIKQYTSSEMHLSMKSQFSLLFFCIEVPLTGAYMNRKIPDFCSSALSRSLGKVTALHWDITAAATVAHYTFLSHGSITLTSCLQN